MINAILLSVYAILEISLGYIIIIRKMVNLKVHVAIPMIKETYVKIQMMVELPITNAHHSQKKKWVIEFLNIVPDHQIIFLCVDQLS